MTDEQTQQPSTYDINKAFTDRNARFEKQLQARVDEMFRGFVQEILPQKEEQIKNTYQAQLDEILAENKSLKASIQDKENLSTIQGLTKG